MVTKLIWPLPAEWQRITTRHGEGGHVGIDISCPNGTPVFAAHDGTVKYEWTAGGGNVVRLVAPGGEYTRYCHLAGYTADDKERVKAGDEVARSNNTGNLTTGPHLHLEYHKANGEALDPLLFIGGSETLPSLFSFQFQNPNVPREMVDKVKASGLKVVKVIDPDGAPNVWKDTGIQVLARFYMSDQDNRWAHQGRYGAKLWFDAVRPRIQKCVDNGMTLFAVETVNEENPAGIADCVEFSDYSDECSGLLHSIGQKSCVYNFGEGNPSWAGAGEYLVKGLMRADYLGLHEYHMSWEWSKPVAQDTWHMLRYRRLVAEIKAVPGARVPPILITESGIDYRGGADTDGWRGAPGCTPMAYVEMMYDYERECKKDGLVKYIFPFISNPYAGQWQSFNNDGEVNDMFLTHIKVEGSAPVEQPTTPPIDVEAAIGAEMQKHIIPLNPTAALDKALAAIGALPASGEFDVKVGDTTYRCQAGRKADARDKQYGAYCKVGDWGNVKTFVRSN